MSEEFGEMPVSVYDGVTDDDLEHVNDLRHLLNDKITDASPGVMLSSLNGERVIVVAAVGEDPEGRGQVTVLAIIPSTELMARLTPPQGWDVK